MAKGGPKLQRADCLQRETGDTTIAPGKTHSDYCGPAALGRGQIDAPAMSMVWLANTISDRLSRTVVDKTGIGGDFQIRLTFSPSLDTARPASPDGAPPSDARPDIFTAVQEQLGLKLVSARDPVEILVVDHVERPSEN